MVLDIAHSIWSTGSWAGVDTFLPHTGLVAGTLSVDRTFWAAIRGDSYVVRETGAGGHFICIPTLREWTTRSWVARVHRCRSWWRLCDNHSHTVAEGIAGESWGTLADWVVVGDLASGVVSTSTRAWINTLLVDTGSQLVTVRADNTLGAAVGWRALECWGAGTDTHSVNLSFLAVWSAWVRITWVSILHHRFWGWNNLASRGWVSRISWVTGADRVVISYRALGIATTASWARITALLLRTGKMVGALGVYQTFRSAANIGVTYVVFDTPAGSGTVP